MGCRVRRSAVGRSAGDKIMSEQHWLSWTGAISGMVGAITGVIGAVLAAKANRRVDEIKAREMRLELRRAAADLIAKYGGLAPLINRADQSRIRVLSARGMLRSSLKDGWTAQVSADKAEVEALKDSIPLPSNDYQSMTEADLEAELVRIHGLMHVVTAMHDKYVSEIAADDVQRARLSQGK